MLAYSGKGRFLMERLDLSAYSRHPCPLLGVSIWERDVFEFPDQHTRERP